ncbi:hypothetical protein G3T36_10660 [Diaminobutyricibacter tongyongensis]|uniref:Uncharacterized protein n=1 Tax=Leifsonia tongyongensis TaxID=1268043 RepID=A0A6L9XYQ3_9MICO|nr:hypothetical protein [Diaminobutyricibacter tongyongensis]NEN06337.1 hypothetical protein [Diaminobutyricibacter tongyongensis]
MVAITLEARDALHRRLKAADEGWAHFGRFPGSESYRFGYFDLLGRILLLAGDEPIEYLSAKCSTPRHDPQTGEVIALTESSVISAKAELRGDTQATVKAHTYSRSEIAKVEILESGIYSSDIIATVPHSILVTTEANGDMTLPLSDVRANDADQIWDVLDSLLADVRRACSR